MSNISSTAVEEYAAKFAQKVCDDFFTMFKNTATGPDILKLSPVPQVNYFILFNLFEQWKSEISKLKSPYFNFDKPEVAEAFNQFANLLSNNILISRDHLEPLVKTAVIQSIDFVFKPIDFLGFLVSTSKEKLSIEVLQNWKKYFKVHLNIIESFIEKSIIESKSHFDDETAHRVLNSIKLQLNPDALKHVSDEMLSNLSKISAIAEHNLKSQHLAHKPEDKQKLATEDKSINQMFAKEQISVSDMEVKDYGMPQPKKEIQNKVLDIKSALTVNQKFMFINHLFKGEATEFDKAVTKINALNNYDDAITFLLENYAVKYGWDTDNEQVEELFELVGRKFLNN
ncbi:MAG: hypothetical protein SNJ77_09080 [Cytophagales bacterium]